MRADVKEKFFPPSPPKGRWVWRFASSPISDLERLWVRDVLQTDQGSRRFLLDGFMMRWLTPSVPEATQANGVALTIGPTMVLFETRGL